MNEKEQFFENGHFIDCYIVCHNKAKLKSCLVFNKFSVFSICVNDNDERKYINMTV